MGRATTTSRYALSVVADRKRGTHATTCHAEGVIFIPMVVESRRMGLRSHFDPHRHRSFAGPTPQHAPRTFHSPPFPEACCMYASGEAMPAYGLADSPPTPLWWTESNKLLINFLIFIPCLLCLQISKKHSIASVYVIRFYAHNKL